MATLISIIIPIYNEEANVEPTLKELKRVCAELKAYEFEYIFTDNCSVDSSFEKLVALAREDKSVRVARFSRNFGFQRSVLTGYRLAQGEAAIQIDADLQDPPSMFASFLAKWREGHDVVVGIRRKRVENRLLQLMRKVYYRFLVRLDGPHIIPDAGDFRLIDQSIIATLRRIDDAHPYLRGLISSLARNQTGIAYDRFERFRGQSKFPLGKLIGMGLEGIVAHSRLPLKLAFHVGLLVAAAATLLTVFFMFSRVFIASDWPAGLATTHILILLGIAFNGLFMGVIGVYVGRIYDQVRKRPTAVIARTVNFDVAASELQEWPQPASSVVTGEPSSGRCGDA